MRCPLHNLILSFFFQFLMAQPIYQEPPAFSHTSDSSYWNNPAGAPTFVNDPIGECKETRKDFNVASDHLDGVKEMLLQKIECCNEANPCPLSCTKIIISSVGRSLLRHPGR